MTPLSHQPLTEAAQGDHLCHALLQVIPSSILVIDNRLNVVSVNKNFLVKARRSESNTIGKPLRDIFPDAICEQTDLIDQIKSVLSTFKPSPGRRMNYRAPGIPARTYFYRLLPFFDGDKANTVILIMEDVTEQVRLANAVAKMEIHLAGVVESASEIILSADSKNRILSWNRAAEEITGFIKEEVEGTVFIDYLEPRDRESAVKTLSTLCNNGSSDTQMVEYTLVNNCKEPIDVSWAFSPLEVSGTHEIGFVAVGRDLKEIRRLERQLFQTQKLAALGVMAGGIAHQIKNPLAIAGSAAQFLMNDDIDPEFRKDCAGKIHTAINKASRIIENLLKFSRPATIKDKELVNMQDVIKEALDFIENEAKIHTIQIASDIPDTPFFVDGNAELLQQVFVNISLNSIRAMAKSGCLDFSVSLDEQQITIRIKDNGKGIKGEHIDKIFDPFFTTTPEGEGSGLGLSICYSIIEMHAGKIEVESKENSGTQFTIHLPRAVTPMDE